MTSRVKVLSVAHTAVSRAAGRLRYHPLAQNETIALRLIVPQRWHQFGRWCVADPADDPIDVAALPIRLPRAGPAKWYLHWYPRLGREIRGFGPDVIHLWEEPWSLVALQASALARRYGAALVLEVDQNIHRRLPPPFDWIRTHVLRRTDLVLCRTDAAADVVRACSYAGPIRRVGYGVDQTVFYPGPAPVPSPALRLGYVGRLVEEKGLDDVLEAMRLAAPARLAVLGEGPHEPALRARALACGLEDRVSFHPWAAPGAVAAFMRSLDALILPTRTTARVKEQFGRVIIEAQACGVPIIGSGSGAIPSVIGRGGWVVPERDPAALAALLDHLARAPAERDARRRDGLANVAARFTLPGVADALAQAWWQAGSVRAARPHAHRRARTSLGVEPA